MEYYIRIHLEWYTRTYVYTLNEDTLQYLLLNRGGRDPFYLYMSVENLKRNKVKDLCKQNKWEF